MVVRGGIRRDRLNGEVKSVVTEKRAWRVPPGTGVQARYDVLLEATEILARTQEPGQVFPLLLPVLCRGLAASSGVAALTDGAGELEVVHREGVDAGAEAFFRGGLDWLRAGEHVLGPSPVGGASCLAVPLHDGARLVGVLAVDRMAPPGFDEEDGRFLQAVARIVSAPLAGAASAAEARRRVAELESLGDAVRAMGASLEFDAVVHRVAEQVHLLAEKPVVVWLFEKGRARAVARAGGALVRLGEVRVLPPDVTERIVAGGGVELGESSLLDLGRSGSIAPDGAEAVRLTVPMILGKRLLGFLAVGPWSGEVPDEERVDLLLRLAPHAATAIENARLHAELRDLSLTDPLVGLPNRRQLDLFLEREFAAARRGRPLCFVLYDLDHFKSFNDTHGHQAGDAALIRFAEVLRTETRAMNLSARYGGEEFATILSGTGQSGGLVHAERVRRRVDQHFGGVLTVSVGVAEYHPAMRSPDDLVSAADRALYRAKQVGRNRVCVADE